MTISESKHISKCMFCGSTSYGQGCPYSPHKRHVHVDDPRRCIYCGSSSMGQGCPYNPFSKIHVRGVEYNTMVKEGAYQSIMASLFLFRLTENISDMTAYKIGLIDERGMKIKDIENEDENNSLTPLDMYILKLRRLIGEDIVELFRSNVLLEIASKSGTEQFDPEKYKNEIEIQHQAQNISEDIVNLFKESIAKGFPREFVENSLIQSIIDYDANRENK